MLLTTELGEERARRFLERQQHKEEINKLRNEILKAEALVKQRDDVIKGLEDRIEGVPEPVIPWRDLLRDLFLQDEDAQPTALHYDFVYRAMCRQENMSQKLDRNHPDLELSDKALSLAVLKRLYLERPRSSLAVPRNGEQAFPFNRLPQDLQTRIFRMLFVKHGLIHCITRLDRWNCPPREIFTDVQHERDPILRRFWFRDGPCLVTTAPKPGEVLRTLLVCRRWAYIGIVSKA
jgi:hypothetical protein